MKTIDEAKKYGFFDIVIDLDDICKYAQLIGVLGIIKYNTLYFTRNNNGKVTKVTSFI